MKLKNILIPAALIIVFILIITNFFDIVGFIVTTFSNVADWMIKTF